MDAIREMIVNAECHRNMTDESCVQVAIYDDRLEVTSPGGLYNGLTFEEAMGGHSKLRNRAIANVFSQIGLIEAWGTGLQRIRNAAKEYGLPDVEFIEMPESFRVNLYRMSISQANQRDIGDSSAKFGESSVKYGENSAKSDVDSVMFIDGIINENQLNIVKMIEKDNRISAAKIAEELKMSVRAIEKNIKELRTMGILIRHGAARGGYWEIRICR